VIDVEGHGTFNVALVLTEGFGARAAKRRSESVLARFEREVAPEWRAHGFTNPGRGGVSVVELDGGPRWAVVISMSFTAEGDDDVVAKLEWAHNHGVLDFR
jgi:hypothetical protein